MHSITTEASVVLHTKALSSSPPLHARLLSGWRDTEKTEPRVERRDGERGKGRDEGRESRRGGSRHLGNR